MIRRSFDKEHFRRRWHFSTLLAVALASVALILQGCGSAHTLSSGDSRKKKVEAPAKTPEPPKTVEKVEEKPAEVEYGLQKAEKVEEPGKDISDGHSWYATKATECDPIIKQHSESFSNTMKADAPTYYTGVVKTFSLDFIQYPFCLENNFFVVNALERKMRENDKYKTMAAPSFEQELNQTIAKQFTKHEERWKSMCEDWTERNKAHQLANLPMVRKVLGFDEEVSSDQLKADIEAFYGWQPWWTFFADILKSGCTRRYTQRCVRSVKVAHRHAKQLVIQTTGKRDMTWHSDEVPADSFLEESAEWRRRVPIELKADGQQLRARRIVHAK